MVMHLATAKISNLLMFPIYKKLECPYSLNVLLFKKFKLILMYNNSNVVIIVGTALFVMMNWMQKFKELTNIMIQMTKNNKLK
jgi:hypothetical protein